MENKWNKSLLPNARLGIILSVMYAIGSLVDILLQAGNSGGDIITQSWSNILKLAIIVFYFISIFRYHKLLKEMTSGNYPISPAKAVGFHFIPFYNFYWAIKWSNNLADFINKRHPVKPVARGLGGIIIIVTFIISLIPIPGSNMILFIGGTLSPLIWFIFFLYINNRFKTISETESPDTEERITPDNTKSLSPQLNDNPVPGHAGEGWALLLLPLLLLLFTIIIPVGQTIILSFAKWNMMGPQQSVGFTNYINLFTDPRFLMILGNTFLSAINLIKLAVAVCLPLLIAFLISKTSRNNEYLPRIMAVISLAGASSLGIAMVMAGFFKGNDFRILRLDGLFADMLFFLSVTLAPGIILFLGIMKGKSLTGQSNMAPGIGLFIITIIAYGFQGFSINYIIAGGMNLPGKNLVNYLFKVSMKMLRLGSGAAISVIAFLPLILSGILVWIILEKSGFKIWHRNDTIKEDNKSGSPLLPIIIIIPVLLIILGTMVYHFNQAFKIPGAFATLTTPTPFGSSLFFTAITILVTTALQLGTSFMGGYALGKLRFKGQKIITLLMCCFLFITPNVLFSYIFINFRSMRLINTILPFIVSLALQPFGIMLFKVYFEGERLEQTRNNNTPGETPIQRNFAASRGMMCLFVSSLLILFNINQVLLPIVTISNSKTFLSSTTIIQLYKSFEGGQAMASAGWLLGIFPFILVAIVLMIILQIRFFPGLYIISLKKKKKVE